jgi:hypothetical protein
VGGIFIPQVEELNSLDWNRHINSIEGSEGWEQAREKIIDLLKAQAAGAKQNYEALRIISEKLSQAAIIVGDGPPQDEIVADAGKTIYIDRGASPARIWFKEDGENTATDWAMLAFAGTRAELSECGAGDPDSGVDPFHESGSGRGHDPWEIFTNGRLTSVWWNDSLGVFQYRMPVTNGVAGSSEGPTALDPIAHARYANFTGGGIQVAYERTGKNYVRADNKPFLRVSLRVRQLRDPGEQRVWVVLTDDVAPASWQASDGGVTSNHVGFRWSEANSEANWFATVGNATSSSEADTGVAVTTNTVLLEVAYDHAGDEAIFAINGVEVARLDQNLPNAGTPTFGWIVLFSSNAPGADNFYSLHILYLDEDAPWFRDPPNVRTTGIPRTFMDIP